MRKSHSFTMGISLKPLIISGLVLAIGFGNSYDTPTTAAFPDAKPNEFDQLRLKVNGVDALSGKLVISINKPLRVSGQFRFVKPYIKGRPPIGSIIVGFMTTYKGKEAFGQAGADSLKIDRNRVAKFSCDIPRAPRPGEYTLKVIGNDRTVVMKAKLRVEKEEGE